MLGLWLFVTFVSLSQGSLKPPTLPSLTSARHIPLLRHVLNSDKYPRTLNATLDNASGDSDKSSISKALEVVRYKGFQRYRTLSKNDIKLRALLFLFYAALGSVMPYIPLYYRNLGISESSMGFLGAITPAVTFLVSPLWGMLADQTESHKSIMMLTFMGSLLVRSLLIFNKKNMRWLSALVMSSALLHAPVKPLMDATVMASLPNKSDFGRVGIFGQLGFALGSTLASPLLENHLRCIFLLQACIALPVIYLMNSFRNPTAKPKEPRHVLSTLRHVAADPHLITFFAVVLIMGVNSGVIENFAYARIAEVGGAGKIFGLCRLLSSIAGVPMFWYAGDIAKSIGIKGVLTLATLSYITRFFIYSSMLQPWHALSAEMLRGAAFALFWSGATCHIYSIAPQGLSATMVNT